MITAHIPSPHVRQQVHTETHKLSTHDEVLPQSLVFTPLLQQLHSCILGWDCSHITLCLPDRRDSAFHNLFSVNLQLNLQRCSLRWGGHARGPFFLFCPQWWGQGEGNGWGGLKQLRTSSGNRIHVPPPYNPYGTLYKKVCQLCVQLHRPGKHWWQSSLCILSEEERKPSFQLLHRQTRKRNI